MKKYYLNLFICALLLSLCSIEGAWAKNEVTFYAKLKTQVASSCSNMGKVYAGTSNSAGTYNASSSTSGELNSGEKAEGTTSADVGPFYAFAQENDNYVFEGWKETDDANADWYSRDKTCQITVTSTGKSSGSYTKTLYAFFSEKKKVTVTMPATEKGSYTYSCADGNGTVNTTTAKEITTDAAITLTATPVSGYKFFGWYTLNGTTESFLNYSATYTTTFTSNTTLYAKFIPSSTAVFTLRGTAQYFYDLNTANSAAVASSNKIIVPTANGTIPAGNYTISGGVTLLIPFDDANTLYTTEPTWPKQAPSGQSAYRKLTLKSGVNVVVNGSISVSAQSQGNQPYGGCVYGKYGQIDMESGATITINNGANLYCWGYITGGGAITAKSGAKVYEDFQLTCWRGGTAASTMNNNASSKGVFPLAQYYIQNIEAPLTLEAGALEYTCTAVTALSSVWDATVQIVGTNSGLFHISSGSITKWYDAAKDRQMYSINGNTKLGAVVVDVSVTISSEKFVLPITNNMDITIASGTLTCDQRVALLPGARIVIDEGATVKFDSGSKLFIYDKDEWKGSYNGSMVSYNYPGNATHLPAPYSPTCSSIKTLRTFDKMDDAELDVNGTLEMTGALYTTIHGANVRSSNGTGIIKYKTSAGTESVTYQAFQGGSGGTEITWQNISITSAKLHNSAAFKTTYGADFEYLATAGTAANTTINYKKGHWGWMEIWKDGETVLAAVNTIGKVNNASAKDELLPAAPDGYSVAWETTETTANQEVIHAVKVTELQKYTITWKDNALENPVIKTEELSYGAQPVFNYQKPSDDIYDYVMLGWNEEGATSLEPIVIPTVTDNATYVALYKAKPKRIVVEEGGELNVDYNNISMTVRVAGRLNVTATIETGDLILEADASSSGEIMNVENVTVTGNAYFDLKGPFKARTWYAVAVPWQVEVPHDAPDYTTTCGIYAQNSIGFAPLALGKDIDLIYYNGERRASEGHSDDCWIYVEDAGKSEVMLPGKAYMFYLLNGTSKLRFKRKSGASLNNTTVTVEPYASQTGNDKDANWNGIANPATFKAYMNTASSNMAQVYVPDEKRYDLIEHMENTQLMVGQPIFVQAEKDKMVTAYADNTDYAIHAPRRAKVTEKDGMKCEVRISALGKEYTDRLYVQTAEDKEADKYIIGKDLAKAGVSNLVPQMWIDRYDAKLCINTLAPVNDAAVYPLGIFAPQTGEYTISINEQVESDFMLYLTIEGRSVWNLSYAPYTTTLEKGTTNRYGLKLVRNSNAPAVTTDIQDVQAGTQQAARKVLLDGQVYILRGNEMYSVDGRIVK